MGKALLLIVAGLGLAAASALLQGQTTAGHTADKQAVYQEDLLAYQIARGAYNAAFAAVHEAATPVVGAALVDGRTGALQGGTFDVSARPAGAQVSVTATGRYGRAVRTVGDTRLDPGTLLPNPADPRPRRLRARFLRSAAGYCSAVFVQRLLPNTTAAEQPAPEMVFESGTRRYLGTQLELQRETQFEALIEPGTQLDFFVGVDQDCSNRPARPLGLSDAQWIDWLTAYRRAHAFNPADYNYVHRALEGSTEELSSMRASPWAFIQRHDGGGERWRIGFEDIHNTAWLSGTTRDRSLFLTKLEGYAGNGWPDVMTDRPDSGTPRSGRDGYGDLTDYGSRPDFDDQVLEVWMEPVDVPVAERNDDGDDGGEVGMP